MEILSSPLQQIELGAGAWLGFDPSWLPPAEADAAFASLRDSIAWAQGTLVFFGKKVTEPRLSAWFGDTDYTYSGRTVRAQVLPIEVESLRKRVESTLGNRFNSVLLNLYRDGQDSMGLHADDEPELGENPLIASISLGAVRRFRLVPKRPALLSPLTLGLPHGSLLVMGGTCQHEFRHGVPKATTENGSRINLTFRSIREHCASMGGSKVSE